MSIYLKEPISSAQDSVWIASIFDSTAFLVGLLELLKDALLKKETSRYVELATKICGNTREVAFEVDFALTGVGSQVFSKPDLLAAIDRAHAAIETSHELLLQVEILTQDTLIAKYAQSTGKRLERLNGITRDKSLLAVYVRLWSDSHDDAGGLKDYKVALESPNDGFVLTAAQWIAHRLSWVLSELKLESGPFYEALKQHQRFFTKQKGEFRFLNELVEKIPDGRPAPSWFVDEIKNAILFEQQIALDFDVVTNETPQNSPLCEEASQSIADEIHERLRFFLYEFQNAIEKFCSGQAPDAVGCEPIQFDEVSNSGTDLGRALLVQEPNAPKKWSAVGLDFRSIGFGDSEEEALASLETHIALELQINPNQNKHRLNKQTLKRFEDAQPYTPNAANNKFMVRRSHGC